MPKPPPPPPGWSVVGRAVPATTAQCAAAEAHRQRWRRARPTGRSAARPGRGHDATGQRRRTMRLDVEVHVGHAGTDAQRTPTADLEAERGARGTDLLDPD